MTISPALAEHLIKSGLTMDEAYYTARNDDAPTAYGPPPAFGPQPAYGPPGTSSPQSAYGQPRTFGQATPYAQPNTYARPVTFGPPMTYGQPVTSGPLATYGPPLTFGPPTAYPQPTFGQPAVHKSKVRWILPIVGATLGIIGILGGVATLDVHKAATSSGAGYNNPHRLENAITATVNQRFSTRTGPYYSKGVSVTDVICVSKTAHTFTCALTASDGRSESVDAVVSADGQSFVTR